MSPVVLLGITGFILGAGGAWLVSRWGDRIGLIDSPNHRSSHSVPTPRGGGIGILIGFMVSCWVLNIPSVFWLPAMLISFLGLVDDYREIRPLWRLLFQTIVVSLFMIILIHDNGFSSSWIGRYIYVLPGVIFIVGTTNFYNFMDGINGLAGIIGGVGFGLMGMVATYRLGNEPYGILSLTMALGCVGFLPLNLRRKARVFMGDVGSVLLGFVFAAIAVMLAQNLLDFICFSAFLFPIYMDELATMTTRLRDKENLFSPHRRHLYQILANEGGIDHWKISLAYGIFQLMVGLSVLGLMRMGLTAVISTLVFWVILFLLTNRLVRKKWEVALPILSQGKNW
jgi:Fuc2NAc and GlcNAc transferase